MIFDWVFGSPKYVFKMVFSEPRFWAVGGIPLVLILIGFGWSFDRYVKRPLSRPSWLAFVPVMLLLVLGARGRLSARSPIRPGTAFFSNNTFANLMSLNPVFTLLNSLRRSQGLPLIGAKEALALMRSELEVEKDKPIARSVTFREPMRKLNVVMVVMESMAAKKTGFLHGKGLTPQLDKLSTRSISFTNAYTLGIHTFNGLYSSVFGLPATFNEHPMKVFPIPKLGGLATKLKNHGYSTHFFVISDPEFDNMAGFFSNNDFEHVIGQDDYPSSQVISSLGVPDHVMFDHSIEYLKHVPQPFFVTYMTGSDHGPYVVPENISFQPKSKELRDRTTEYADWSVGRFLEKARQQPWFDNTLFVFVADHGAPIDSVYDISLEYHHTPLFFYCPKYLKPQTKSDLVSQMDIYPSVMGILKAPYVNESLGVDVFAKSRRYIPLNSDNAVGALDHEFLYVYRRDNESLYRWPNSDLNDFKKDFPEISAKMKAFTLSLFQAGRELAKPEAAKNQ